MARKATYGSGTVRSLGVARDGVERYEIRWRDKLGQHSETYRGTKSDAETRRRQLVADVDAGVVDDRTTTFGEWADTWLGLVGPRLAPRSLANYEYTIEHYLLPRLGRHRLVDLDETDVVALVDSWTAAGAEPAAIRKRVGFLRMIVGKAHDAGKVKRNWARLVDAPKYRRAAITVPSTADVVALIDAARGTPDQAAYALAAGTGMRQGEMLALRWRDVDLDGPAPVARISASADAHGRRRATKTRHSVRTAPLPAFAVALLRETYDAIRPNLDDAVVATRAGNSVDPRNLLRRHQRACAELGLPAYRWHDLRHYAATEMLRAGVPIATVSRALGHSNIATTVDTYGHMAADQTVAAALNLQLDSIPQSSLNATGRSGRPRAILCTNRSS